MKASQYTAGSYLKSENFPEPVVWTIERITAERCGEEDTKDKLVVYCEQCPDVGIPLNRRNTRKLVADYGDFEVPEESEKFKGQKIGIYTVETELSGKPARGIRIKKPNNKNIETEPDF